MDGTFPGSNTGMLSCRRRPGLLFVVSMLAFLALSIQSTSSQTAQWQTSPTPTQKAKAPKEKAKAPAQKAQKQPTQKAQASASRTEWNVTCQSAANDKGLNCRMSRAVVLKEKRKLLLRVTVSLPAETKKPSLLIQLPHGLFLPAGAKVGIDDKKPKQLVLQTCDQKGCYAASPIPDEQLAAMKKGQRLKVIFQNLQKKPITVAMVLSH
jgi:invasion protein IalB